MDRIKKRAHFVAIDSLYAIGLVCIQSMYCDAQLLNCVLRAPVHAELLPCRRIRMADEIFAICLKSLHFWCHLWQGTHVQMMLTVGLYGCQFVR